MNFNENDIKQVFKQLHHPDLLKELEQYGKWATFHPGDIMINYGHSIKTVPLVMSGSIKVIRQDEEGNEIFLYYLKPGQTCAMSLTCCSTYQPSQIRAEAEDTTLILAIPIDRHEQWMNRFREWKELVANTYSLRFQELLQTIDSIAFKKMDERLLEYLHLKFQQRDSLSLTITHQEIANELGTSREVISRLLKQMERRGIVTLGRNKIYRKKSTTLSSDLLS